MSNYGPGKFCYDCNFGHDPECCGDNPAVIAENRARELMSPELRGALKEYWEGKKKMKLLVEKVETSCGTNELPRITVTFVAFKVGVNVDNGEEMAKIIHNAVKHFYDHNTIMIGENSTGVL